MAPKTAGCSAAESTPAMTKGLRKEKAAVSHCTFATADQPSRALSGNCSTCTKSYMMPASTSPICGGPSSSEFCFEMAKSRPVRPARTCASTRSTSVTGATSS